MEGGWLPIGWVEETKNLPSRGKREWFTPLTDKNDVCYDSDRVKWGQLWLCLSSLLKWSSASHTYNILWSNAGTWARVEKNKGCGWKLPTGPNCNISGPSQGKKRRTTPLLIKRREAFSDWAAGERKRKKETEEKWRKQKRQRPRVEESDWKDRETQWSSGWIVNGVYVLYVTDFVCVRLC